MGFPEHCRALDRSAPDKFNYSICTLVTDPAEYAEMVESFVSAGFDPASCEYLYIDNSRGNQCDAYAGCNLFLSSAQGEYIILCHQDVVLKYDRREHLERGMKELDQIDPTWAVLGNAGGVAADLAVARISDPDGHHHWGRLPAQASSLDENFILVKRRANLCLSRDLSGFHLYGTDLCQLARMSGWGAWVVNFHLFHKSRGNRDRSFYEIQRGLVRKYQKAMSGRAVQTTCTRVYLSGSRLLSWLWNAGRRKTMFDQLYEARKRQRREGRPAKSGLCAQLAQELGSGWYALYWAAHKVSRPFQNLRRHLRRSSSARWAGPGPPTKFRESKLAHKYLDGLTGLEIGGSAHNPFGLNTKNVDFTADLTTEFKQAEVDQCGTALPVDIVAPGDCLPVPDNSQDFVISSHVIEHFFDPIKALKEWHRVVRPGGYIFLIVPHKERTFDKERPRTALKELIARHDGLIGETDPSRPAMRGHHSVWITKDFLELCRYLNLKVIDYLDKDDKVGNGFAVLIQKEGDPIVDGEPQASPSFNSPNQLLRNS